MNFTNWDCVRASCLWHSILFWVDTNISKEYAASIFRITFNKFEWDVCRWQCGQRHVLSSADRNVVLCNYFVSALPRIGTHWSIEQRVLATVYTTGDLRNEPWIGTDKGVWSIRLKKKFILYSVCFAQRAIRNLFCSPLPTNWSKNI